MKTLKFLRSISLVATVAATTTAFAIPVEDVGSVDSLIAATSLASSGEDVEESWVESILGVDVTFIDKIDGDFTWEQVTGVMAGDGETEQTDIYAQYLEDAADYFLVKTGSLKGTSNTHFLFENVADLAYAVIDLTEMGFAAKDLSITKVSHLSLFGGSEQVPEPSSLVILGMGIASLLVTRRQRH